MVKRADPSGFPLQDLVIVELGHSIAALYASQIPGDLGAKVIKIEKAGAQALEILQQATGRLRLVELPVSFDGVRPGLRRQAAKLGQDNEQLFKA